MKIAVTCPTRRPEEFIKLVNSILTTAPEVDLLAYVDNDMRNPYGELKAPNLHYCYGDKIGPCASVNRLVEAFPDYEVYGVCPDDCAFETPGWDVYMAAAFEQFPGRLGTVSPAHNFGPFMNFPFVSKEWIKVMGWFACPRFYHFCWDTVIEVLGNSTRIAYPTKEECFCQNQALTALNFDTHFSKDCAEFIWWTVWDSQKQIARLREACGIRLVDDMAEEAVSGVR